MLEIMTLVLAQLDDDTPCVEPHEIPLPDASDTATDYDLDEEEAYQIDEDGEVDIWERYLWNLERQERTFRQDGY